VEFFNNPENNILFINLFRFIHISYQWGLLTKFVIRTEALSMIGYAGFINVNELLKIKGKQFYPRLEK
jgi:hypothetical protein